MKFIVTILLLVSVNIFHLHADGYEIRIKLKDFVHDTIVIGHRFNASYVPKDSVVLDKNGEGIFKGEEALPQGMYLVFLPNQTFFDLLIGNDQEFYVENDTADFVNHIILDGSEINSAFYAYQQYLQKQSNKAKNLQEKLATSTPDDSVRIKEELDHLNVEVMEHINSLLEEHSDNFFGTFLLALQEIKVPDPPLDENGNVMDPAFQYRYYKKHYFDNFDISDVRLLRTPFYEQKIMTYIDKVAYQAPDSLIMEVDMLIEKSRTDPQLFRYMLITLFNHFAKSQIMGMDGVYIHIAEKYYIPEAEWSDPEFISDLEERVAAAKPTLIGQTATDIQLVNVNSDHFMAAAENEDLKKNPYVGNFFQLYDIKAPYTILYFWESDCGHCQKATPKLYDVYQRLKEKGIEVVAVHTLGGEEGKVKWINYINENGFYDWINCWNPYDFAFKEIYNVTTTPALYVLDENKRIIAKKIEPEQAEKIIDSHLARK